jgi:peptide/nickel transport system ATP-binding protein
VSAVLEVAGLTVDIPVAAGDLHAVRGIDFTVEKGETLCIVGESGCGKSLTSLSIMGLLPSRARVSAKTMSFNGVPLLSMAERDLSDIRGDRMAMIFQEPMTSLNPAYSIGNQLMEPLIRHRNASKDEARKRAIFLLEKVGITAAESRLNQFPHQLSGGLRQRVMIAMALMCDPELIIASVSQTSTQPMVRRAASRMIAMSAMPRNISIGVSGSTYMNRLAR